MGRMMCKLRVTALALFAMVCAGAGAASAQPQLGKMASHLQDVQTKLGSHAKCLSSGAQNAFGLVNVLRKGPESLSQEGPSPIRGATAGARMAARLVSDPNLTVSRLTGFTQSESSTAWCGNSVVAGFNDSGAFASTFVGSQGISLSGFAVSGNKGANVTYKGALPPSSDFDTMLSGDPALICRDAGNFLYASLFEVADNCFSTPTLGGCNSGVAISSSTDGGNTFGVPVEAVFKDANTHFLDKEWMANNPGNPAIIYITYTDFDFTGDGSNGCGVGALRTGIELVSSTDGGSTWSGTPTVVDQQCTANAFAPYDSGSQVAIDRTTSKVYVAWEHFGTDFFTREIDVAMSSDGGASFSVPVKAADAHPAGDGGLMVGFQGNIRNTEFPSLAVGKSSKDGGVLYLTWNDGDRTTPDAMINYFSTIFSSFYGIGMQTTYNFSDVLFTSSANGGVSWTTPVKVNNSASVANGSTGWDAFRPGLSSDKNGTIGVCWYDRRKDGGNFLRNRYCARSSTGGASWTNNKVTAKSSPSVTGQDILIAAGYDGDYDVVTSDFLNLSAGFAECYSDNAKGNPNVYGSRF